MHTAACWLNRSIAAHMYMCKIEYQLHATMRRSHGHMRIRRRKVQVHWGRNQVFVRGKHGANSFDLRR
jgi:hypothetical protein